MGRWHEAAGGYGGAAMQLCNDANDAAGTAGAAGLVPAHTVADYLS